MKFRFIVILLTIVTALFSIEIDPLLTEAYKKKFCSELVSGDNFQGILEINFDEDDPICGVVLQLENQFCSFGDKEETPIIKSYQFHNRKYLYVQFHLSKLYDFESISCIQKIIPLVYEIKIDSQNKKEVSFLENYEFDCDFGDTIRIFDDKNNLVQFLIYPENLDSLVKSYRPYIAETKDTSIHFSIREEVIYINNFEIEVLPE